VQGCSLRGRRGNGGPPDLNSHAHTCSATRAHTHMHTCTCTHAHTHTHTHTHAHTHRPFKLPHSPLRTAQRRSPHPRLDRRVTVMGGVSQPKAMDEEEEGADNAPSFPAVPIGARQSAPASCPYEPTQDELKRVDLMVRAGEGLDAPFAERLLEVARLSPCACACLPRLAPCRATGAPLALQENDGDVGKALDAYYRHRDEVHENLYTYIHACAHASTHLYYVCSSRRLPT
jgi:hypothetical protein